MNARPAGRAVVSMIDRSHVENGAVNGDAASRTKSHATERDATLDAGVTNDVPLSEVAECAESYVFLIGGPHNADKNGVAPCMKLRVCSMPAREAQIHRHDRTSPPRIDAIPEAQWIEASLS